MMKLLMYSFICMCTVALANAAISRQCKKCPISNYPVCATNGTNWFLFKNECRLIAENVRLVRNRETILQRTEIANCFRKCDQLCTREYAPICATNCDEERTFGNRCRLDLENCRTGYNWTVLHEGPCSDTSMIPLPIGVDEDCPTICPMDYKPICASFGDYNQTFPNMCVLKADICISGRNWQIINTGVCVEPELACDQNCPKIYSPLCATFNGENRTFDNECLLDAEICVTGNQWDILYRGECERPATCPTICPTIFNPVCASYNGERRTFSNQCALDIEVCRSGNQWVVENNGSCEQPPPPQPPRPTVRPINRRRPTTKSTPLPSSPPQTSSPATIVPPETTPTPVTSSSPQSPITNCPLACPDIFAPVCTDLDGSRQTFPNACEVCVDNCKTGLNRQIISNGTCEEGTDLPLCPSDDAPICASLNGVTRTFPNQCQMNVEIDRTQEEWEIVGRGECGMLTTTVAPIGPIVPIGPTEPIGLIGPIGPCPKCTNIYKPVCGFLNGEQRTFINQCQMMGENCYSNTNWVLVYEGECRTSDQRRNCPNVCPLTYSPVCAGFNGEKRTFPNECELNHEVYRSGMQWVILNQGECDYCPLCTDQSDPVCAKNNDQMQTFDNSCKMEYENCKTGSEWKIISRTSCEDIQCPNVCPQIYSPVCASSTSGESKTFSNTCEMKMEACISKTEWTVINEGECPAPNVICPETCALSYSPVCGVYQGVSKTFQNECILRKEVCRTKNNWLFAYPGPCYEAQTANPILPIPSPEPLLPEQPVSPVLPADQLISILIDRLKAGNY